MVVVIEYKCQHSATFFAAQQKLMLISEAYNYTRLVRFHTLSFLLYPLLAWVLLNFLYFKH